MPLYVANILEINCLYFYENCLYFNEFSLKYCLANFSKETHTNSLPHKTSASIYLITSFIVKINENENVRGNISNVKGYAYN